MVVAPDDVDLANRHLTPIAGRPLIAFRLGGGVLLEFGDQPFYEILVEGRIRVTGPDRPELHSEPVTTEVAAALVPLLNTDVTAIALTPAGILTINFGATRLTVEPDMMYEAWQLRADNGLLVVNVPGGSVAIWEPE
ncbi:DUF6188 family protein [Actinoplanes sp. HUAS TT8]|uniref:DUF6188 family protein n=1 Tax=Actinoplanes sp. HUAS TT8 TaxID=3447453 RepID=UPI003F520030